MDVEDGGFIFGIDGGRTRDVSDCRSSCSLPCRVSICFPCICKSKVNRIELHTYVSAPPIL